MPIRYNTFHEHQFILLSLLSYWLDDREFRRVLIKLHAVAQLVEALCYKPEGREFDSQ
jgi:hypothetical protein